MKKIGIFSECFVENVHICKTLHKFYLELGFCQYYDCLTKLLHTVSVLTKLFLLSIYICDVVLTYSIMLLYK